MTNTYTKTLVFSAFFAIVGSLFIIHYSLLVFAQSTGADTSITISDLGIINPGTLPTSPFYFLKQWGRTFRRAVTFDPVKKAELELKIANTKAAELKKVAEIETDNTDAIKSAMENYEKSQERLKARFESLKETSVNPNVDKLLDEFTDKIVKHDKIFDEIAQKFEDKTEIQNVVSMMKQKIEETVAKAAEKDKPAEFAAKMEKALVSSAKNELEHIRSIEILDRVSVRAPEAVKQSLERLRDDFSSQFQENVKSEIIQEGADAVKEKLQALPGDFGRRAVIFEEIKPMVGPQTQKVFEETGEFFTNKIIGGPTTEQAAVENGNKDILAQKAREQFEYANGIVKKLIYRLAGGTFSEAISALAKNAADRLEEARQALDAGEFEKVFGAARSAEVLARNALQMIEKAFTPTEDFEQIFKELEARMTKYANVLAEKGITADIQPKAYEFLANVKKHLGLARDAFAKGDVDGVKTHIRHVREYLQNLASFVEWFGKGEGYEKQYAKPTSIPTVAIPPTQTKPVEPAEQKPYMCAVTEQNLKDLDLILQDGKISKEDYERKYAAYTLEIEKCSAPSICPDFAKPSPELEKECLLRGGQMISKTDEKGCKLPPLCTVLSTTEPKPVEVNAVVPSVVPAETKVGNE